MRSTTVQKINLSIAAPSMHEKIENISGGRGAAILCIILNGV